MRVIDIVPLQRDGDFHGLTGYYLVIGWIVGGYLVAALLGVASDAKRATRRRTIFRPIALILYAIISGLAGAIVVGPVLGALTGHLLALWWLGALLVFAVGAVTLAFQTLFGVIGIGVTILVFVILGNPSGGGAYQPRCCRRSGAPSARPCPTAPRPTPCVASSTSAPTTSPAT